MPEHFHPSVLYLIPPCLFRVATAFLQPQLLLFIRREQHRADPSNRAQQADWDTQLCAVWTLEKDAFSRGEKRSLLSADEAAALIRERKLKLRCNSKALVSGNENPEQQQESCPSPAVGSWRCSLCLWEALAVPEEPLGCALGSRALFLNGTAPLQDQRDFWVFL